MRHRVYGKHLGRNKNQRTALFRSLVRGLLLSGSIQTTETKAKAIKGLVDKIITQAKSLTTQRLISQFLTDKILAEKLIKDIAPRLSDRLSGYTSIIKVGKRQGDGGMVVRMSLLLQDDSQKTTSSLKQEKKAESKEASAKVEEEGGSDRKTQKSDRKSKAKK